MTNKTNDRSARNRRSAVILAGVVAGMVGLAYASVPLYQLFCQVTGYGGTPRSADYAPAQSLERHITVRFNADISRSLLWRFRPAQKEISLRIGEQGLAFYQAANRGTTTTTGTATYNVTPLKVGAYFNKIDCFCFEEQSLAPGQHVDMPVAFYIDPAIDDDPNMKDISTITLSYTFFPVVDDDAGDARTSAQDAVDNRKPGIVSNSLSSLSNSIIINNHSTATPSEIF